MDFNRTPHQEMFKDYFLLKNYAINRDTCFNDDGDLLKIDFDEDIRAKYAKVYEGRVGVDITTKYHDVDKIISKMQEDIIITSTRIDGIVFTLLYAANIMEISMTKQRLNKGETRATTRIFTYCNEDKIIKSFIKEEITLDPIGKTINEEVKIVKAQLGLTLEGHVQSLINWK